MKTVSLSIFGLTMVPFDWDAIDRKYMTDRDISLLNEYHSEVYKRISPYLDEDEKAWLRENDASLNKF